MQNRPIFVTGASSGIGLDITRRLAAQGHPVYATARKEGDLQALAALENVTPVRLDVRDPQQVREAAELVARNGGGLYGLVNNAGIGELGLVSTWTDEELHDIFDVNVFGPFRLTNALLPLLVEARGRVVLISSQGGMISKKYYGPYTMTKHALEAYSVAVRDELAAHGVLVSIVQPGGVETSIGENSFAGMLRRFERAQPPFKAEADAVLASFNAPPEPPASGEESESNRKPSPPALVTEAVVDALFSAAPKFRYLVGTKWEGDRVIHALIEKLLDENDNPVHNYSQAELAALLARKIEERKK
ncbi:MAG: corticosteroid 11-beta-dehydrogenase [Chloroflexi bacterium HGW-Chloroflexi-6]|nr:MAG: corticosteroid 11-beta-dehydrogenase [Chloroflexi bacterium HGW-Chloroflexi-6]